MAITKFLKTSAIISCFICSGQMAFAQDDPTMKPGGNHKSTKQEQKAAKAEEKIHEKSKKEQDEQISEFHKKHYKKQIKKQQAKVGKGVS